MINKIIIYLGHPAHFHLLKNVITKLISNHIEVLTLIKTKDVLEELLRESDIPYNNILPKGRRNSKFGIFWGMIKRDFKLFLTVRKFKPDLLVGTSVENSHMTKIFGIPSINLNEDDSSVVPLYAFLSYPWATEILTPDSCDNGKWNEKSTKYNGYHELAYLHPDDFKPHYKIASRYLSIHEDFVLLRFSSLNAHHDYGIRGIDDDLTYKIVEAIKPFCNIYISSEKKLDGRFERYRISISPSDLHHVLAFAKLLICDSQTMAAEAGVLGTPFIRYNDFVGKIGYLNELEEKYKLGYGFNPPNEVDLLSKIKTLLSNKNLNTIFNKRRVEMLNDKINVNKFLFWYLSNYPESSYIMKNNPEDLLIRIQK